MDISKFNSLLQEDLVEESKIPKSKKLGYVLEDDKITLSFSRRATLYSCPRKFLLKEINQASPNIPTIDTSYGSAFGAGVQELFRSGSLERSWLAALAEWDYQTFESEWKNKADKSFWCVLASLEAFYNSDFQALNSEYELAYIEGKPGIELFVYLHIGESYNYQIHVDLVLASRTNGALVVAEIKTSGTQHVAAQWENSEQTLGYFAVLEFLTKKYQLEFEPRIIYITQHTGKFLEFENNFGFTTFIFEKPPTTALDFARNVVCDVEIIELYIKHGYFPKRGTACVTYNRTCEFYGVCDMESMQYGETHEGNVYESLTFDDVDFQFDLGELIAKL